MKVIAIAIVAPVVLGLCVAGAIKCKEEYVPSAMKAIEAQAKLLEEKQELLAEIEELKKKISGGVIAEYAVEGLKL